MELLNFKYFFFLAYTILGYIKSLSSGERKYLLFSLLGLLGFVTNLLDYFVFSSNLELYLVNDLVSLGLYFIFFFSIKNLKVTSSFIFIPLTALSIIALLFFNFDWPKSNINLYSNYGYLNTLEYLLFSFFASLTSLTICTIVLIKMFTTNLLRLNLIFLLFGILSFYLGDIIQSGLGIYFISDTNIHFKFSEIFLTIRLFVSNGLIIFGLLWKN